MNIAKCFSVAAIALSLAAFSAPLRAQDETPAPQTTQNPTIEADHLKLRLRPLTADEVKVEVDGWQGLVKAKATEISAAEIAGSDQAAITGLVDERSGLISRFNIAIRAYEEKGGDVEAYDQYMAAVNQLSGWWTAIQTWALSESGGVLWATNIITLLVIIFVFKILASIIAGIISKVMGRVKNVSDLLRSFFVNTTRKLIFFIGVLIGFESIGVSMTPFVAALGAAGFIIGFALQGTLGNFAAGIMILLYRPYDIGDVVTVAGTTGKVEAMSLVSTSLLTPDNQRITIPNGSIWGGIITNITANDTRRVDLVFGIGYGDDIAKAQKVLEEIVNGHELVLKDPEPVIKVHELADSSVNFVCRPWTKTSDYWAVYWDLTRAVKERFDAEEISIPFPQQDVYMHQVAG